MHKHVMYKPFFYSNYSHLFLKIKYERYKAHSAWFFNIIYMILKKSTFQGTNFTYLQDY
jgi:hypothetical protein